MNNNRKTKKQRYDRQLIMIKDEHMLLKTLTLCLYQTEQTEKNTLLQICLNVR